MNLIKVQAGVATRESLPSFLVGLQPESLADLSWTDPSLGVRDCAWWPEDNQSPALGANQAYGAETLTVDAQRKVVVVVAQVIDLPVPVPQEVSRRQGLQAIFLEHGLTQDQLEQRISQIVTDPTQQYLTLVEIRASQTFERDRPTVVQMCAALGWDRDALFIKAASLS